jgi:DNA-binding LacI/PurR family transcriptional regulator
VDDVLGGDLAVSHLLEAGHDQIAFVGGPLSIRQVADRRDGAIRAMERVGRAAAQLLIDEALAADTHRHRQVVFEPDLVIRASSQRHPGPARTLSTATPS